VLAELDEEMDDGSKVRYDPAPLESPHPHPLASPKMSKSAKMGWGEQDVAGNPDEAKKEAEFYEIKNAIEQIMEYKVLQR